MTPNTSNDYELGTLTAILYNPVIFQEGAINFQDSEHPSLITSSTKIPLLSREAFILYY